MSVVSRDGMTDAQGLLEGPACYGAPGSRLRQLLEPP